MAITASSGINELMFVSELSRLSVYSPESDMTFAILKGGEEVFRNTYVADSSGYVTIYDLDKLLESLIPDLYADFTFMVNDAVLGVPVARIFRCSTSVNEPGLTFIPDFFLTSSFGERDTCLGRYEALTAYCLQETAVKAYCSYYSESGTVTNIEIEVGSINGASSIDVSADLFDKPEYGRLIAYTISCGYRRAKFRVLDYAPAEYTAIIFRNAFNCWETIYLTGTKETSSSYTRNTAYINGRYRCYDLHEVMSHKVHTGPLRAGALPVAIDLARAKTAFILNADASTGAEITITDADIKHTDNDDELCDLSITYRLADLRNVAFDTARPPQIFKKVFDKTFDHTYE